MIQRIAHAPKRAKPNFRGPQKRLATSYSCSMPTIRRFLSSSSLVRKPNCNLPSRSPGFSQKSPNNQSLSHSHRATLATNAGQNRRRSFCSTASGFHVTKLARSQVASFHESDSGTWSHILTCNQTKQSAIIDSSVTYDSSSGYVVDHHCRKMNDFIKNEGLKINWILETHVHADHISAAPYFKQRYPEAKVSISKNVEKIYQNFAPIFNFPKNLKPADFFDTLLSDSQVLQIGNLPLQVVETPGHTPACLTYVLSNEVCFVGDTVFAPDSGTARCDFPGGSAESLYESIQKIFSFGAQTQIFLCHDYKSPPRVSFSVQEQIDSNIHVAKRFTKESFLEFRKKRDAQLNLPKLILPSLQANLFGGVAVFEDEGQGKYIKIPLNSFLKKPAEEDKCLVPTVDYFFKSIKKKN